LTVLGRAAIKLAIYSEKCGAQQINAPFERQGSWFTLLFEGYAMMILAYWEDRATDKRALSDVSKLALDEITKRRGHQYITVVIAALRWQTCVGRALAVLNRIPMRTSIEPFFIFLVPCGLGWVNSNQRWTDIMTIE